MMTTKASSSNQTIGSCRRSRYQRVKGVPLVITPVRANLLRLVSKFRVTTSRQLSFITGLPPKTAARQLRYLFDGNAIRVVAVPRAVFAEPGIKDDIGVAFGSALNIYQVTKTGQAWLFQRGLAISLKTPQAYTATNWRFIAHAIHLGDVRAFLYRAVRINASFKLEKWSQERPAACAVRARSGKVVRVNPDAHFVLRVSENGVLSAFTESDRSTEGRKRWIEKLALYRELLLSDQLKEITGYRHARLLIVTLSQSRRDLLSRWVHEYASEIENFVWLADSSAVHGELLDQPNWIQPSSNVLKPLLTSAQLLAKSK